MRKRRLTKIEAAFLARDIVQKWLGRRGIDVFDLLVTLGVHGIGREPRFWRQVEGLVQRQLSRELDKISRGRPLPFPMEPQPKKPKIFHKPPTAMQ